MNTIRMYDADEGVLIARISDYQKHNIGDGYFIVSREEWLCKDDDGLKRFYLNLAKLDRTECPCF